MKHWLKLRKNIIAQQENSSFVPEPGWVIVAEEHADVWSIKSLNR